MSSSDLKEQIKLAQQWHTPRYEIDRELLQAGHNPAEIDLAWAQLEGRVSTPKTRKKINLSIQTLFSLARLALVIILTVVLISSHLPFFLFIPLYFGIFLLDNLIGKYVSKKLPPKP